VGLAIGARDRVNESRAHQHGDRSRSPASTSC
jgi:hypothetical protein